MSRAAQQLKFVSLVIGCVTAIGTVGYRLAGLSWEDALYQTMITIATVGYSDVAEPHDVKWFTMGMVALGTLAIAVFFAVVTGFVVETRMREIIGRRKMKTQVRKLKNHIILCGYGRFGRIVSAELTRRDASFVVIEVDPAKARDAREHGILVMEGDATEEETLTEAHIEDARGLITTLATDAANVYVALSAKQMHKEINVVAIAREESAVAKLRAAGADEVVSPYRLGGTWMAQMIMSPAVSDFMKLATGVNPLNFSIDEQRIDESSALAGHQLKDAPIRRELGVIVLAVRRTDGTLVTNPPPEIELMPGDVLVSLGEEKSLEQLKALAAGK